MSGASTNDSSTSSHLATCRFRRGPESADEAPSLDGGVDVRPSWRPEEAAGPHPSGGGSPGDPPRSGRPSLPEKHLSGDQASAQLALSLLAITLASAAIAAAFAYWRGW
jgi:hypothetical protein